MGDFTATINEKSERATEWREVFGSNTVPILAPLPELASVPGIEAALFYQIDLSLLTAEQRAKMIRHIALKFHIPASEVDATLDEVGCPILADDITVTVFHPQRWF